MAQIKDELAAVGEVIYDYELVRITGVSPKDQYDITSIHIGGVKIKKIKIQYIGGILGVKRVFFLLFKYPIC